MFCYHPLSSLIKPTVQRFALFLQQCCFLFFSFFLFSSSFFWSFSATILWQQVALSFIFSSWNRNMVLPAADCLDTSKPANSLIFLIFNNQGCFITRGICWIIICSPRPKCIWDIEPKVADSLTYGQTAQNGLLLICRCFGSLHSTF